MVEELKYLVISDIHGDESALKKVLTFWKQKDIAAIFICGDTEFGVENINLNDTEVVKGNMDHGAFVEEIVEQTELDKILMVHGHTMNVNMGLDKLYLNAVKQSANLVFYGHTHVRNIEQNKGVIIINPGSLTQPRGADASVGGSYCVVTSTKNEIKIQFFTENNEKLGIKHQLKKQTN